MNLLSSMIPVRLSTYEEVQKQLDDITVQLKKTEQDKKDALNKNVELQRTINELRAHICPGCARCPALTTENSELKRRVEELSQNPISKAFGTMGKQIEGCAGYVGKQVEGTANYLGGEINGTAKYVGREVDGAAKYLGREVDRAVRAILCY